ncbi:hypothetical protein POM88_004819 [Heracleum sosnowskyi]|uniref:Uncharacterized protein n=1 Tax=Heracleum sosnowskyi TaxID=360622 RepID=A0AAD8NCW5_9APIA|nr:hypothetical protein POM88_004819 [Heracleum sosnowskyi]
MRAFFQGLYLSPQMVGEALKGSLLIAEVMAMKGYKVQPLPRVTRHDTVQLGSREVLLAFCEAVQRSSPVGSFTKPVAGATPGYASEVIFADGTFIDGSTSELSCDGPLREPYSVFCQEVLTGPNGDYFVRKESPFVIHQLSCPVIWKAIKDLHTVLAEN